MTNNKKIMIAGAALVVLLYLGRKPITKKIKKIMTDQDKINFIKSITPEVTAIAKSIGVPPIFMIAQICLETRFGNSELFTKHYNVGGVKAVGSQPYAEYLTTECKNGVCSKVKQKFAKYSSLTEGLKAHGKVLTNRYFKQYTNKTTDPMRYAQLLQSGQLKYATQPDYVTRIGSTIKELNRLLT